MISRYPWGTSDLKTESKPKKILRTQGPHETSQEACHVCPACGNSSAVPTGVQFYQRSRGESHWMLCVECRSVFATQPYDREEEAAHSQTAPWGTAKSAKLMVKQRMEMYRSVLRLLNQHCPPPALLLDVGCSYGGFLIEARQAGYSVMGVDIVAGAVEYVRSIDIPAELAFSIRNASMVAERTCDILTCLDCNYYWRDQRAELREAFSKLKPGGYLMMRVVDKAWMFRVGIAIHAFAPSMGKLMLAASVNDHRFSMPVRSLLNLIQACGFQIVYASPRGAMYSDSTRWPVKLAFWFGALARDIAGLFIAPGALILARRPLDESIPAIDVLRVSTTP